MRFRGFPQTASGGFWRGGPTQRLNCLANVPTRRCGCLRAAAGVYAHRLCSTWACVERERRATAVSPRSQAASQDNARVRWKESRYVALGGGSFIQFFISGSGRARARRQRRARRRREAGVHAALHDLLDHRRQQRRQQRAAAVERGRRVDLDQVHLRAARARAAAGRPAPAHASMQPAPSARHGGGNQSPAAAACDARPLSRS